ncbi:MAG: hypothetical protein IPM96_21525 [Ignavibacteria bacterium]|nr:hypothetical protein [Ignavibacteria bacterium]
MLLSKPDQVYSSPQSLFGVADFQLGGLSKTAVVSQKKSKTETKISSGGAQDRGLISCAADHSDNRFLDTACCKSKLFG